MRTLLYTLLALLALCTASYAEPKCQTITLLDSLTGTSPGDTTTAIYDVGEATRLMVVIYHAGVDSNLAVTPVVEFAPTTKTTSFLASGALTTSMTAINSSTAVVCVANEFIMGRYTSAGTTAVTSRYVRVFFDFSTGANPSTTHYFKAYLVVVSPRKVTIES